MKMIYKLIAVFSVLAIMTTAANSIYFYLTRMADLDAQTYNHLTALSNTVKGEIEQYVRLMDYAMESLAADPDFMNAFYDASHLDDESDVGEAISIQNKLSFKLLHEPILKDFYRVSVFSPNGFFISSRLENSAMRGSMSEEAKDTIRTLSYRPRADAKPFRRIITEPHADPWIKDGCAVFSTMRSVAWRGENIGYVEVSADLNDLTDIFMWNELDGFLVQGIFDDGSQLFRNYGDDVVYANLNPTGLTRVREDGVDRLVVGVYSEYLRMTIYVSQDMSIYNEQAIALLMNYVMVAAAILAVTLLIVTLCSLGLTQAIRKLTRRVNEMPVDSVLTHSNAALTETVTRPQDREIHNLERTLNHLMVHLQSTMLEEIALREGAWQARMNALQMQINPHFIYNTLNVISAKGLECGSVEITDLCDEFASMLRYAADLSSKTATLGEELQNAQRYLHLLKARYEDKLTYVIDVPEHLSRLLLPKLTLQPIVENAITHGFVGRTDPREVHILGEAAGDRLLLTIRDNGNGFSPESIDKLRRVFAQMEEDPTRFSAESGEHLGLTNTYLRLLHASKGRIRMHLNNAGGAVITLTLPLEQEG